VKKRTVFLFRGQIPIQCDLARSFIWTQKIQRDISVHSSLPFLQHFSCQWDTVSFWLFVLSVRDAMIISGNPNLQEIWDMQPHDNVTVMKGSIRFIDNAKLCLSVISDFVVHVHIASGKQPIIPHTTNGYSAICMYSWWFHVYLLTLNFDLCLIFRFHCHFTQSVRHSLYCIKLMDILLQKLSGSRLS